MTQSCLGCGAPIKASESHKCAGCKKKYFCDYCAEEVDGKYYCEDCIENKLIVSPDCGKKIKYDESHECVKASDDFSTTGKVPKTNKKIDVKK